MTSWIWPCSACSAASACERFDALLLALADADEDPAREGDLQLARRPDRLGPPRWMLGRRPGVHRLHQTLRGGLEHQPLRGAHLAQARQVGAREHAQVGVRQQAALERSLACPRDIAGEVRVPVLAEQRRYARIDLGALAGEHQQLLDLAPGGPVEHREHLVGRVKVGPVCGERAVLAVAATGPRQRQRQVARERDPATHLPECRHRRRKPAAGPSALRRTLSACPRMPCGARLPSSSAPSH